MDIWHLLVISGFLSITTGEILLSKRADYKVMDKAPESTSRIAVVPYVTTLAACLIECSQVEICKAVVHDGSDCSLYNTITGS